VFGLRPLHGFLSATFGAGVNATHCPITCPKRQLPRTLYAIAPTKKRKHLKKLLNKLSIPLILIEAAIITKLTIHCDNLTLEIQTQSSNEITQDYSQNAKHNFALGDKQAPQGLANYMQLEHDKKRRGGE
jgi:hypothetical protein